MVASHARGKSSTNWKDTRSFVAAHPFFAPAPGIVVNTIHTTPLRPLWIAFLRRWVTGGSRAAGCRFLGGVAQWCLTLATPTATQQIMGDLTTAAAVRPAVSRDRLSPTARGLMYCHIKAKVSTKWRTSQQFRFFDMTKIHAADPIPAKCLETLSCRQSASPSASSRLLRRVRAERKWCSGAGSEEPAGHHHHGDPRSARNFADGGANPAPARRPARTGDRAGEEDHKRRFAGGAADRSIARFDQEPIGDQGDYDLGIRFEGGISIRLPLTIERAKGLITLLTGVTTCGHPRRPLGFSPR